MRRKSKINFLIMSIFLLSFVLLGGGLIVETNSKYISTSSSENNIKIATWDFKVNGVTSDRLDIDLVDTIDSSSKYGGDSVVPGSTGVIPINIDCTNAKVAIDYSITINSSNLPDNLKLYVDSGYTEEFTSFSGTIGVNDVKLLDYQIYWKWDYTNDDETVEWSNQDLSITFDIVAVQRIDGDG